MIAFAVPFALWLAVKVLVTLGLMLGVVLVVIWSELKWSAHIQSRIGPWYAGGRWGWAQPLARSSTAFSGGSTRSRLSNMRFGNLPTHRAST